MNNKIINQDLKKFAYWYQKSLALNNYKKCDIDPENPYGPCGEDWVWEGMRKDAAEGCAFTSFD